LVVWPLSAQVALPSLPSLAAAVGRLVRRKTQLGK